MGDDTTTSVSDEGSRVTFFVIRTTTLWCGILFLSGSALDRDRRPIVAGLIKRGTRSECHGITFRFPENICQIYLSIKGVRRSISAAKFLTILRYNITCKLSIRTK